MRWRGERQRLKQRFGAPGHFAQAIGQMAPDSFTHGISQQRMRWFTRGMESGDARQCDTFSARTLQGLLRP